MASKQPDRKANPIPPIFVLYVPNGIFAIEVKNSNRIRPEDLRSLSAFRQDYPQGKAMFLYRGNEKLLRNDVLCMPCDEFLKTINPVSDLSIFFP